MYHGRSSDLLHFFAAFPFPKSRTVAMDAKKYNEAYSIGKCLGITPGSLLIPYAYGNLDGANVGK
jgi:hypothetical protein